MTLVASSQSTRPLNFLVQNCIRLESGLFKTRPLDFLVQNIGPFTTPTCGTPRCEVFGWLALRGRLQCRANLVTKGVVLDDMCTACRVNVETSAHILFHCEFAKHFWASLHQLRRPQGIPVLHYNTFVLLRCWGLWKKKEQTRFRWSTDGYDRNVSLCPS